MAMAEVISADTSVNQPVGVDAPYGDIPCTMKKTQVPIASAMPIGR